MKGVEKKRQDIKILDVSVWPHNYKWSTTAAISCASMTPSHLKEKELYTRERKFTNYKCAFPPSVSHTHHVCFEDKQTCLALCAPQALDSECLGWRSLFGALLACEALKQIGPHCVLPPLLCVFVSLGMLVFHDLCDSKIWFLSKLMYLIGHALA